MCVCASTYLHEYEWFCMLGSNDSIIDFSTVFLLYIKVIKTVISADIIFSECMFLF